MCQFQHLYKDSYGYVIRCTECQHYQLSFNKTVLSITEEELHRFSAALHAIKEDIGSFQEMKEIVVPTPYSGLYMLLSGEEVLRFASMLEAADAECSALSLLSLFGE